MEKVLVIEDNKDSLKLISYALTRSGYEVVAAETGEDGVALAVAIRPRFIIMDVGLPGIDGIEATRRIKKAEACYNVPIIAITSYAMAGDRERVLAAGCVGYFEKPIDPLTIVEKIHSILKVT
jgi:two-component system cell cycle response regulator DivK